MRPKLNLKSKSQMPLSHEHVGSKILAKIKIYTLTRAELLFNLCYEIPCTSNLSSALLQILGLVTRNSPFNFVPSPFFVIFVVRRTTVNTITALTFI